MIRFECKKCGSLVVTENGSKSTTCSICGKTQRIPDVVIEDRLPVTRNNYDPQYNHYAQLMYKAKTYRDIKVLKETAEEFDRLGEYENSREMAAFCRNRAAEEESKRKMETEKRRLHDRRNEKGRRRYHVMMGLLNAGVLALIITITLLSNWLLKRPLYNDALALMNGGMYHEAISTFRRLGSYKDSRDKIQECEESMLEARYNVAITYMEKGHYPFAITEFTELSGYKDSDTYIIECKYRQALKYMDEGQYGTAWQHFSAIAEYKNSAALAEEAKAKLSNP